MVPFLLVFAPMFVQVLAYLTSDQEEVDTAAGVTGLAKHCYEVGRLGGVWV